ncbi:putative sialate O-acetylesterase domain, SGNH hydrolase superfamily [Helianthus annuus]|nr:putative sialate O-acetylesterase domain, SGNH hydrolase superfamily [Helianthus annuus]KAJ0684179.1 putative sialate O-acetylesterase domain, SGNH hydrolase superfamily [Helianthus annuus]KAJ0688138.1 putative sialate O-acetylesterase domain, SGNH hydrolase superfamily [Helianthus annuus]
MLAFLCLILHLASAYGSTSKGKSIILLAGQSNMSGRGGVHNNTWDGVVPLQSQPNPSILRLTANLTWVEAREPLHKDIDVHATCGVGPGMAFANRLLQRDPGLGPLGLVPCAVGGPRGTSISEWGRGTFLYKQLLRRAKVARRDGGSISGMLWYQGESDTVSEVDARMYKMRLVNLFRNLRADLGTPLLPIVHVRLFSFFVTYNIIYMTIRISQQNQIYVINDLNIKNKKIKTSLLIWRILFLIKMPKYKITGKWQVNG